MKHSPRGRLRLVAHRAARPVLPAYASVPPANVVVQVWVVETEGKGGRWNWAALMPAHSAGEAVSHYFKSYPAAKNLNARAHAI